MLLNRNGAPVIADEDIIKTFFKPGGATPARRFLDMLGDNPVAIESMEAGIRERYRQEVIRNGAVDPAAHARVVCGITGYVLSPCPSLTKTSASQDQPDAPVSWRRHLLVSGCGFPLQLPGDVSKIL
jgi:hypothetical protein